MIQFKDLDNIIRLINSLNDDDFDSLMLFLVSKTGNKSEINELKKLITSNVQEANK